MIAKLDPQAAAAVAHLVRQHHGQLPGPVETLLTQAEAEQRATDARAQGRRAPTTTVSKQMSLAELEQRLIAAMPDQQQTFASAINCGRSYVANGAGGTPLTTLLAARIERSVNVARTNTNSAFNPRTAGDPYYIKINVELAAKTVLLFNARDVDREGNPLLMKVVMRMTPAVEAAVAGFEAQLDRLVAEAVSKVVTHRRGPVDPLPYDVKAWTARYDSALREQLGLPHGNLHGTEDVAFVASLPDLSSALTRGKEIVAAMNEVKRQFIAGELPPLGLANYRQLPGTVPDVALIGAATADVEVVDENEHEFRPGDPVHQVSLNADGTQRSSSDFIHPVNLERHLAWADPVSRTGRTPSQDTTVEVPDRHGVVAHLDRVKVAPASTGQVLSGGWIDSRASGDEIPVRLHIERGVIFEPGATASFSVRQTVSGACLVPKTPASTRSDGQLLGNDPLNVDVARVSLRDIYQSALVVDTWASNKSVNDVPGRRQLPYRPTDLKTTEIPISTLVFGDTSSLRIGARPITPLGDTSLEAAAFSANKIAIDATRVAGTSTVKMRLRLGEGFLASTRADASVQGYQIQVGYLDANSQWKEAGCSMASMGSSPPKEFELDIADFDNAKSKLTPRPRGKGFQLVVEDRAIEIRIYNPAGFPVERLQIPLRTFTPA